MRIRIKFFNSAVLSLIITISLLCGCFSKPADSPLAYYSSVNKEVFASGITFSAAVRGGDEQAALSEMLAVMDEIDREMSLTKVDSALSRFNEIADATSKVQISESLYELVSRSIEFYDETDGKLNIAIYPIVKLWGLSSENIGGDHDSLPSMDEISSLLTHCNPHDILLESVDGEYYISKRDPLLKIDLGGVAKGFAADKCIEIARSHGAESALINISGNVSLLGDWYHPTEKKYVKWEVGVVAPRPRGGFTDLCALSVGSGKTLVTSGDYMRYYTFDGVYVPHIVDGKSGLPLGVLVSPSGYENSSDFVTSATVICRNSLSADAYATALCLMGYEGAVEFMLKNGLHGVILTSDGRAAFVGVSTESENGEEYLVYKDSYSGYKKYAIEEYAG